VCLLSACKLAPIAVEIAPTLAAPVTGRGHGITLGVRVIDARPHDELGRRAPDGSGLDVITAQDLPALWGGIVDGALRAAGFQSVPYEPNHEPSLTVWIKELDYQLRSGFWARRALTTAAVKAEAVHDGRTHEVSYQTSKETRVYLFRPTLGEVESALNEVSSDVLNKLFRDSKLMTFLAAVGDGPSSDR
jgi:uncharacterized lipoprotein YajG